MAEYIYEVWDSYYSKIDFGNKIKEFNESVDSPMVGWANVSAPLADPENGYPPEVQLYGSTTTASTYSETIYRTSYSQNRTLYDFEQIGADSQTPEHGSYIYKITLSNNLQGSYGYYVEVYDISYTIAKYGESPIRTIQAEDGEYPNNGFNEADRKWYIKGSMVNEPPSPPTGLTIPNEIYGGDTITISWNAGTDPEGMPLTYVVVRSIGGNGVTIGTTTELSIQDTIDPSWEKVRYFVRSKDPLGLESTENASTPYVTIQQKPIAYYNDNGVIKKITKCFYNDSGVIKRVSLAYNDNGKISTTK